MDYEGIEKLLRHADEKFPRLLKHSWVDAGYRGEDEGKGRVEKTLGWSVELVERARKPAPEKVLEAWAAEWAKEGKKIDWQKLFAAARIPGPPATLLGSGALFGLGLPQPEDEQGLREVMC